MERGNTEHGRHLDDNLRREAGDLLRGQPGAAVRSQEWRDPEPPGEDQPEDYLVPEGDPDRRGSAPSGMTADQREERSRLGRYLPRSAFPGEPEALASAAREQNAPDDVIASLHRLPAAQYQTVAEVYAALLGSTEEELEQRF